MSDFLDNVLARSSATPLQIAPRPVTRFEPLGTDSMAETRVPSPDLEAVDGEQVAAKSADLGSASRSQRQSTPAMLIRQPGQPEIARPVTPPPIASMQPQPAAMQSAPQVTPVAIVPRQTRADTIPDAAIQSAVASQPDSDQHSTWAQPVIAYRLAKHPTDLASVAEDGSEQTNRAPAVHSSNQVLLDPTPRTPFDRPPAPSIESERHVPAITPNQPVVPLVEVHSEHVTIERVLSAERALNPERDQPMPVLLPAQPVPTPNRALADTPGSTSKTTDGPVPSITVTIGRIEVRATPPAPAPTQRQRSTPPVLSLDEYLRQRTESQP